MKLTKLAVVLLLAVLMVTGSGCGGGNGEEPDLTPTPAPTASSYDTQPIQSTDFMTYNAVTGKIDFKYDLNNSDYYWEIAKPPCQGSWICQEGDPTIMYYPHDGQYYVIFRQKNVAGDKRMKRITLNTSSDLVNWSTVWRYHKDDIRQLSVNSIERSSLRYYNDRIYLYFAYDTGSGDWNNSYVVADDFVTLGYNLTNASTWNNISYPGVPSATNPGKHSGLYYWNGNYYETKGNRSSYYSLMTTDSLDKSWANLSNPAGEYYTQGYSDIYSVDIGTITYDPASDLFIVWGHSYHTAGGLTGHKFYWWWATSPDLVDWTFRGRQLQISSLYVRCGTRRYPELSITESGNTRDIVLVMHWDHDGDCDDSVILWHFMEPLSQ